MTPTELREARKRLGLTQVRLAEKLNIAEVTLIQYERGYRYDENRTIVVVPRIVEIDMRELEASPPRHKG